MEEVTVGGGLVLLYVIGIYRVITRKNFKEKKPEPKPEK